MEKFPPNLTSTPASMNKVADVETTTFFDTTNGLFTKFHVVSCVIGPSTYVAFTSWNDVLFAKPKVLTTKTNRTMSGFDCLLMISHPF
jgi:hypothetical protein